MGTFSIKVDECSRTSRVISGAGKNLNVQAAGIKDVRDSLDSSFSELFPTLDNLEQQARQEALHLSKAGDALYLIAKAYEQAENNILQKTKPTSTSNSKDKHTPMLGDRNIEFYEREGEKWVEYLKENWVGILKDAFSSLFVADELLLIENAVNDYRDLIAAGASNDEALFKAVAYAALSYLTGDFVDIAVADLGAVIGTFICPGPGTFIGYIAGELIGSILSSVIVSPYEMEGRELVDAFWDEFGDEIEEFLDYTRTMPAFTEISGAVPEIPEELKRLVPGT